MTNAGLAISVIEMIKRLKERHDQETQRQQQSLEQAASKQQQQDEDGDGGGGCRGGRVVSVLSASQRATRTESKTGPVALASGELSILTT